jgi:hemerythrin-like domain-containing protein
MSSVSEAIHNHHQEIIDTLTGHVAAIVEKSRSADPKALVSFLKDDLLPHAQGEEIHLYPAVDPLVKAHGSATATMTVDHEFITGYIERITETVQALESAAPEEKAAKETELQRLSLQLEAVLLLHLEKEERVYIPLFEKYLPADEQQRILDGMHEAYPTPAEQAQA